MMVEYTSPSTLLRRVPCRCKLTAMRFPNQLDLLCLKWIYWTLQSWQATWRMLQQLRGELIHHTTP